MTIKGQLDDFDYVAINGMKLTDPRQSYVQILKQLGGKTATWEQAYRILEKRFHSVNSKMTLLLVDEVLLACNGFIDSADTCMIYRNSIMIIIIAARRFMHKTSGRRVQSIRLADEKNSTTDCSDHS